MARVARPTSRAQRWGLACGPQKATGKPLSRTPRQLRKRSVLAGSTASPANSTTSARCAIFAPRERKSGCDSSFARSDLGQHRIQTSEHFVSAGVAPGFACAVARGEAAGEEFGRHLAAGDAIADPGLAATRRRFARTFTSCRYRAYP